VLALLRGQPAEEVTTRAGTGLEELAQWEERYFQAKVPPTRARLIGHVDQPVEILRDRWGIPHIFAGNAHDLFLGFGFAMGQDRLFQMDYYRHVAYGRLAELVGERGVRSDITARTLNFASTARQELENLSPEAREAVEAYSEGVNLAIAAFGDELPFEFDLLEYRPDPWRPEDNLAMERSNLWDFGGRIEAIATAEAAYRYLPPHLAERILSAEYGDVPICQMSVEGEGGANPDPWGGGGDMGSNNWAVSARRSASGGALLASDGHIAYTQPATNYEIHLHGEGYDMIGVVRAARLMPNNGRNQHVAWGLTNNNTSTRDLYLEQVHPEDPNLYRHGDDWLPFEERRERILVRGGEPIEVIVRSTVLGPIVNALITPVAEEGDPPLSLRWIGADPCDTISVSLRLMRARDAAEFREILADWPVTASNPGFVDDQGRCAVQIRGRVPRRDRVILGFREAGNPDDEWQGFLPYEAHPYEFDPPKGWIASANNRPAPPGYPWPFYGNYADGYRMVRIVELLTAKGTVSLEDMADIQYDVFFLRAAEVCSALIEYLRQGAAEGPRMARAIEHLEDWDHHFTVDSIAASIYSTFWEAWMARVIAARFPPHLHRIGPRTLVATELIAKGDEYGWFPQGREVGEEIVAAMMEGLDWLSEHLGPDMDGWTWGQLHPVTFRHYLTPTEGEDGTHLAQVANVGPYPCPGTTGTLNNAGFAIGQRYQVAGGPHFRFLVDMAEPSQAWGCNSTGNSGHPGSPHYRDQIQDWLGRRYHPMHMRREDIEANLEGMTVIGPE
jgi:penicillin amidase